MFEKFTAFGAADFNQRYRGTYGYFTRRGQRTLVQISEVNVSGVKFVDKYGLRYELRPDADEDTGFVFITPKSEYYNTLTGTPILVRRIAAKQYMRGICDKNTTLEFLSGENQRVSFEHLESLYGGSVPFVEALNALRSQPRGKNKGIALSRQLAYWHGDSKLKLFNLVIGEAEMNWKGTIPVMAVTLHNPEMWGQEVRDALKRNGIMGSFKDGE